MSKKNKVLSGDDFNQLCMESNWKLYKFFGTNNFSCSLMKKYKIGINETQAEEVFPPELGNEGSYFVLSDGEWIEIDSDDGKSSFFFTCFGEGWENQQLGQHCFEIKIPPAAQVTVLTEEQRFRSTKIIILKEVGQEFYMENIFKYPRWLFNIEQQTPEICIAAVGKRDSDVFRYKTGFNSYCFLTLPHGKLLKGVEHQTLEICEAAVTCCGEALEFVKEQTPYLCMCAVKENGFALQFVREQTPEICLAAVWKCAEALQFVKKQTLELCFLAVTTPESFSLQFVREQTPEICIAAVKTDPLSLHYVKEQTPEICIAACDRDPEVLECVREQTPEICMVAVRRCGFSLEFVKNQTPDLCMAAVKQMANALQYVKKQTPEICNAAIQNHWSALQHVINPTDLIIRRALKGELREKRKSTTPI